MPCCQWPFQEPRLEVPTIYKAYFLGLNLRAYPHNSFWPVAYGTYQRTSMYWILKISHWSMACCCFIPILVKLPEPPPGSAEPPSRTWSPGQTYGAAEGDRPQGQLKQRDGVRHLHQVVIQQKGGGMQNHADLMLLETDWNWQIVTLDLLFLNTLDLRWVNTFPHKGDFPIPGITKT